MNPYPLQIQLHNKTYELLIHINAPTETFGNGEREYHYDLEIHCQNEKLSGHEFQALRKYLEEEGHLDAACTQAFPIPT